MYVDSHCHLTFPELSERLEEIRAAMQRERVDRALCICTTLEEFERVAALAQSHENFWCSVGVHPDNEGVEEPSVERLVALAATPKVVALGETGLDYYRLGERSAAADTLAILREEGQGQVGGVFHCFTETQEVADAALDLGFYISFSGILTFKNAAELREVARRVPLDRCLIETDSPYLAPVPHRGKVNDPSLVPLVARQLAELKGLAVEEVAQATSANFERLFKLGPASESRT